MKIDAFFRKQSKPLAEAGQLPDDAQAALEASAKPLQHIEGDLVKADQNSVKPGALDSASSMDIDQVCLKAGALPTICFPQSHQKLPAHRHSRSRAFRRFNATRQSICIGPTALNMQVHKLKQHKVESIVGSASTPLSETTNQQQATNAAAPASGGGSTAKQQLGFASDTIDLSSDSPQPAKSPKLAAAAAAANEAVRHEQQKQDVENQLAQAHETEVEAMELDEGAPLPAAAAEAGAAAATVATGTEPATPAVKKAAAAGAATPGSALNTSTAKVPAEAFLTPEQRQQLLQACIEVWHTSASVQLTSCSTCRTSTHAESVLHDWPCCCSANLLIANAVTAQSIFQQLTCCLMLCLCLQEMPLLEAELGGRPDLAAELAAFQQQQAAAGKKAASLDLKFQVRHGRPSTATAVDSVVPCCGRLV
jgi:hypothetical protein